MSERAAGILMPISSLPSEYGIGCFSKSAYEFVDWLKGAGQSYWQILPLGPTSYGDSPYQSFSTFAGNPYFISLDELIEEGVLTRAECEKVNWGKAKGSIDYLLCDFFSYRLNHPQPHNVFQKTVSSVVAAFIGKIVLHGFCPAIGLF